MKSVPAHQFPLTLPRIKPPWTHRLIAVIAADLDLLALRDAVAFFIEPHVHRGLAATAANRFHFLQIVGERQQRFRAGKWLAQEITAQAVANHRRAAGVRELVELRDLRFGHELRLVDEDARGQGALAIAFSEVGRGGKHFEFKPNA